MIKVVGVNAHGSAKNKRRVALTALYKMDFIKLNHPSHSPYRIPCIYYPFSKVNEKAEGLTIITEGEVKEGVLSYFISHSVWDYDWFRYTSEVSH